MPLSPGTRLGPYEITGPLGVGGMGEVYRARDTKLGREVALKVLPDAFARDPERLARFQHEARLLAALNHPHIAAIHGLEEAVCEEPSGGAPARGESARGESARGESAGGRAAPVRFLVLELVPGETLAERIGRGALPIDEALAVGRQIAEALEAAHERGIIHRDLKPANVKVTPEGQVKLLDFGLGKAFGPREISPGGSPGGGPAASEAADPSQSPTLTAAATREGVILGTAAYMSPEQARGRPVDKRTDIWAFGCVLYEALTGQQAFKGETVSDTIARILEREPDWRFLPARTPLKIRELLARCLHKDLHLRLHDIGDARIEIHETLTGPPASVGEADAASRSSAVRRAIPWGVAALSVILGAGIALWGPGRPPAPALRGPLRFVINLPSTAPLSLETGRMALAVSSDGSRIVYVARVGGGTQLFARAMDRLEVTPIPGTEGAGDPFFSPDGRWVGFFAGGKLKKVSVLGGAPMPLCDAPQSWGGSWGSDDTILFVPNASSGVWRVPAQGGAPQVVTTVDRDGGEQEHDWPVVLADGKAVLFTIWRGGIADADDIAVQSLETGARRILVRGGNNARYSPTGHLVYGRAGALLAVPFDLATLEVTAPPAPVLEGIRADPQWGDAQFAVSASGVLAYVPGNAAAAESALIWVDRQGKTRPLTEMRRVFTQAALSPDGRRLAVTLVEAGNYHIGIYDLARDALTRLTFEGSNLNPVWSPDGRRVAFLSTRTGRNRMFWAPADGSGAPEEIAAAEYSAVPSSWSPDGRYLAFSEAHPATKLDVWILPLEGERAPRPFLRTKFDEWASTFSPDGQWMAYVSNESGRNEIYVQPFPAPGGKWQVSTEGGESPVWAPDGRELFYSEGDKLMAAAITTRPDFGAGRPRMLFEIQGVFGGLGQKFGVAPDGQRFVMIKGSAEAMASTEIYVVLNWFEELKRRASGAKE